MDFLSFTRKTATLMLGYSSLFASITNAYELNANSIPDIKTFKSSSQLSFHRRVEQANRKMF
jgi:hypothetical protein